MSDYARIADAIRFIASQVERQPTLDEIAAHVHLSPFHFQRLFRRWAGVTPKRYLQVLTLERAKALLQESRPLLEVADTLGLSSGSRLYDHFVQLEAVTPGEYKQRGAGLVIDHGVHDTPFGQAFVALTPRGVCNFSFLDEKAPEAPLANLARNWPEAELREAPSRTQGVIHTMFEGSKAAGSPHLLARERHQLSDQCLAGAAADPARQGGELRPGGERHRQPQSRPRSGAGGGRQPRRLDDPLSPGHPAKWQTRRLSLGRDP